ADNIKRWQGQFVPPKGKSIGEVTTVEETKVSGAEVTYVDIHGTYLYKKAPFDPNAKAEPRPDYRRLGVIFGGKEGPYFITLTGPSKTVEKNKAGFDSW